MLCRAGAAATAPDEDDAAVVSVGGDDGSLSAAAAAVAPVDTLSDIDDAEIDGYLASAEEATIKKEIWTACNQCAPVATGLLCGYRC
jgi:hypothetical protein